MGDREELAELRRLDELETKARQATVTSNPGEYDPQSKEFQAQYGPESGMGTAFFSGVKRANAGVGNLLRKTLNLYPGSPGNILPGYTTNEAIKESEQIDAPMIRQHPIARIGGEIAGTLPMSMATGGTAGALGAAGTAGRVLANPYLRAGVEGAVGGAALGDPEHEAASGGKGAVLGATLQALFGLGGRAVRGLIQKAPEMEDLEHIFGQHGEKIQAPISQAAGDQDIITRLGKSFYQEALPLIPGVKGKLERQAQETAEKIRELSLKEATPTGMNLPAGSGGKAGETIHTIRQGLQQTEKEALDSFEAKIFPDLLDDIQAKIRTANPKIDDTSVGNVLDHVDELMARFTNGTSKIEGQNLKYVVDELTRKAAKAAPYEKEGYELASQHMKEIMHRYAKIQVGDKLSDLEEPMRHFVGLEAAINAARTKRGNFSMADLARKAKDAGQLDLASTANAITSQPATKASLTGRILAGAGIGGFGAYMSPLAAGGALLGGNLMATKAFQKALLGDTQAQEALKLFLSQHPEMMEQVASALKTGSASQVD